jgi:uncharacterized RDD family membrane protein YckC
VSRPGIDPASLAFPLEATKVVGARGAAHLVDGLIYNLGFLIPFIAAAAVSNALAAIIVAIWALPGLVLYFVLTQRGTGRSPGKRLLGLRVVDAAGEPPSTGALVRRTLPLLFEYLYLISLIAILTSPTRQRLGDRWASTYVIANADFEPAAEKGADLAFSCGWCGEGFADELSAQAHVSRLHKDEFPDPRDGVVRK